MAGIIGTYETPFGVTLTDSYSRIDTYRGTASVVVFLVKTWADGDAWLDGKQPIYTKWYSYPCQEEISFTTLYTYLLTLPEFVGCQVGTDPVGEEEE